MFEQELSDKLKAIFGVKDISYSQPSDSREQECLFLEIESSKNTIKDGRAIAKVIGNAVLIANADKLPFGFFAKKIYQADATLTEDIFFHDIETNVKTFGNIIQRGFSFVYFYNAQYDPEKGTITSIELDQEES